MTFPKHDHVIKQFAPKRTNPSFRIAVLPRGARRNLELFDAQV
jgi:hypothetical protein